MTSVPELTRLLARIAEWQEGHGKGAGPRRKPRAGSKEANKLEVSNMLGDVRRELLGSGNRAQ